MKGGKSERSEKEIPRKYLCQFVLLYQKYHLLDGLNNIYSSQFWRLSPSSTHWQVWCLVRAGCLAHTQLCSLWQTESAGLHEDISGALPTKDLNQIQLPSKGPICNTITLGFRLPHMNLQLGPGDTNTQSIAGSDVWSEVWWEMELSWWRVVREGNHSKFKSLKESQWG